MIVDPLAGWVYQARGQWVGHEGRELIFQPFSRAVLAQYWDTPLETRLEERRALFNDHMIALYKADGPKHSFVIFSLKAARRSARRIRAAAALEALGMFRNVVGVVVAYL